MAGITDPLGLLSQEFKCPICGSEFFGTNLIDDIGYCKGSFRHTYNEYSGCSFRWPRSEDSKYFYEKHTKQ